MKKNEQILNEAGSHSSLFDMLKEEFGSQSGKSGDKRKIEPVGKKDGFSMKSNIMNFFSKVNKDTKMKKRLHKHRTRFSQVNFSELKKVKRRGITMRDFSGMGSASINEKDLPPHDEERKEELEEESEEEEEEETEEIEEESDPMPSISEIGELEKSSIINKPDSRTTFQKMLAEIDTGEDEDEELNNNNNNNNKNKRKLDRKLSFFKPKNIKVSKADRDKMDQFLYNKDSNNKDPHKSLPTPAVSTNRRATAIFEKMDDSPGNSSPGGNRSSKRPKIRRTIMTIFRVFGEKQFWQKSHREIRNDLKKYRSKFEEYVDKLGKKVEVICKKKEKTLVEMYNGITIYRNNSLLSLLKYFRKLYINKLLRYNLIIQIEKIYQSKLNERIQLIGVALTQLKKTKTLPYYVREAFFVSSPEAVLAQDKQIVRLTNKVRCLEKLIPQMERIYHIERRIRAKGLTNKEMKTALLGLIEHAQYIYHDEAIDRFEDLVWQDEIQDQFNKLVRDIRTIEGEQVEAFLQTVQEVGLDKIPPMEITMFISSFVDLMKKTHKFTKKENMRLLKQFSDKLFFSLIGYQLLEIEYGLVIQDGMIEEFLRKQDKLRLVDAETLGVNPKFLDLSVNFDDYLKDDELDLFDLPNTTTSTEELDELEEEEEEEEEIEESIGDNNNNNNLKKKVSKRKRKRKKKEKPFLKALSILTNMEYCVVPNDMVWSIYCAARSATNEANELCKKNGKKWSFGADELMPIIIYLIIHSDTPYLSAHLSYLSKFSTEKSSESVYYLTCFEGAVMYIQNLSNEEIEKLLNQIKQKKIREKKEIGEIIRKKRNERNLKQSKSSESIEKLGGKKKKSLGKNNERIKKKQSAFKKLGKLISPPKRRNKNQ